MEAATKERELSGEKAQRIVDAMRDSVAPRRRRLDLRARRSRGRRQPRPAPLLLRDQGAAAGRGGPARRRAAGRPARRAARQAETVDDVLDVLVSSLTDMIDNEPGFFLLLYELFAGRRDPNPARGRPALRSHPLPRRRGARRSSGRACSGCASTPRRSSPTSSRSATASPCRRSPIPSATTAPALAAGAASARYLLVAE